MTDSLIQKMRDLQMRCRNEAFDAMREAILIVKEHQLEQAEQPKDVVERVERAIRAKTQDAWTWRDVAEAAIAAMGDATCSERVRSADSESFVSPASGAGDSTIKHSVSNDVCRGQDSPKVDSPVRSSEISDTEDVMEAIRDGLRDSLVSYRHGDLIANPFLYGKDLDQETQATAVYNAIRRYLRHPETAKCPDCGADMIEVCSGLENISRGDAASMCRHSDYCEKPIKPVSVSQCERALYCQHNNPLDKNLTREDLTRMTKAVLDAAGVKYVD